VERKKSAGRRLTKINSRRTRVQSSFFGLLQRKNTMILLWTRGGTSWEAKEPLGDTINRIKIGEEIKEGPTRNQGGHVQNDTKRVLRNKSRSCGRRENLGEENPQLWVKTREAGIGTARGNCGGGRGISKQGQGTHKL